MAKKDDFYITLLKYARETNFLRWTTGLLGITAFFRFTN